MLTHREAMEESVRVGKIARKNTERRRIPVLLNGEGHYVKKGYPQPIAYYRNKKIDIPPGCFVMMVAQDEFDALKNGHARMLADGELIKLQ